MSRPQTRSRRPWQPKLISLAKLTSERFLPRACSSNILKRIVVYYSKTDETGRPVRFPSCPDNDIPFFHRSYLAASSTLKLSPWELGICGLPGVPDAKNKWTDRRMSRTWNPATTAVSLLHPTSISSLPPLASPFSKLDTWQHTHHSVISSYTYCSILRIYVTRWISSKWKENNCTLKIYLTLYLFTAFHLSFCFV